MSRRENLESSGQYAPICNEDDDVLLQLPVYVSGSRDHYVYAVIGKQGI
jgi:hypothetical protein